MKHDEFWQDTLGDAMPGDSAARTIAAMQREHRRAKHRRHLAGATSAAAAFAIGALALRPAREPAPIGTVAASSPTPTITVRNLTDDELLARFPEVGVALAGTPEDRRLLIIFANGDVLQP